MKAKAPRLKRLQLRLEIIFFLFVLRPALGAEFTVAGVIRAQEEVVLRSEFAGIVQRVDMDCLRWTVSIEISGVIRLDRGRQPAPQTARPLTRMGLYGKSSLRRRPSKTSAGASSLSNAT